MNKSSYPLEIQAEIDGIVARWQVLHQRLIWTLVAIASAVELIYLVALNRIDGFLSIGLGLYFLKYVMAPVLMSLALALASSWVSRCSRFSVKARCYATTLAMTAVCLVLYTIHNLFPVLRMLFILSILLTATYGDMALTTVAALANAAALMLGDLVFCWDAGRQPVTSDPVALLEFFLALVLLVGSYLSCRAIIYYEREKNQATARQQMEQRRLRQELSRDSLTGLGNRKALREALDQMVEDARPRVFAMIDLDHFKQLNDTYGHLEGDRCLHVFSQLLEEVCAGSPAFRYGGDEFCVLFDLDDPEQAAALCRELDKRLEQRRDLVTRVRCSFGLARFEPGMTAHELLQRADEALYRCKNLPEPLCIYS